MKLKLKLINHRTQGKLKQIVVNRFGKYLAQLIKKLFWSLENDEGL